MPGFVRFLNQSDKNNRSPCHFIKRQRAVFASAITAIFLCRFLPTIWTVYKTRRAIPQAGYESRVQYHIAHGKQGNPFCSLWPFAGYLYVCGPAAQIAIPVNHSQIRYTAENLSTTSHRPCTGHTLFVIFYRASSFLSSDIPARSSFSIWLHSSCAASILAALSLIHI